MHLHGWQVQWVEFQSAVNQPVLVGYWFASRGQDDWWVSTTLGTCEHYAGGQVFEMTLRDGETFLMPNADEAMKAAAKERAFQRLDKALQESA